MTGAVEVRLPPVLAVVTGGVRTLTAHGNTVGAVLEDLARAHPALALHLFDERHAIRRNILCIHDGVMVRPDAAYGHALKPGDALILANALAGG